MVRQEQTRVEHLRGHHLAPEALSALPRHSLDGPQDARHDEIDKAKSEYFASNTVLIRGLATEVPPLHL
jgi:hypothetical protein